MKKIFIVATIPVRLVLFIVLLGCAVFPAIIFPGEFFEDFAELIPSCWRWVLLG